MKSGQILAHYEIIQPLGKGGMGEVYLAQDTKLDRRVAVKVLPDAVRQDPERLARFRREAKAAASLQHPNIATIHALEEIGDGLFIVMEYVEGDTLAEKISAGGMALDTFFPLFIPLSDALAHAHENGRVHRDLKPGNIMITQDGIPKILDFGMARIITVQSESLGQPDFRENVSELPTQTMKAGSPLQDPLEMTPVSGLLGTPMYMSPEQIEQVQVDHRSDIFSFGVVMYEALTGRKTFEDQSHISLLNRILKDPPESITVFKPLVPYLLVHTIESCLRKSRDERTQNARELHADLQIVHNDTEAGITLIDAKTLQPPVKSNRLNKLNISTLILTLVACLLWGWSFMSSPEVKVRKFLIDWPGEHEPFLGPSISPDGTMIVYKQNKQLWIRNLDQLTSKVITVNDEDVNYPIWSPDSDFIIYIAANKSEKLLKRIDLPGGSDTIIGKMPSRVRNICWGPDRTIIISHPDGGLYAIPENGGDLEVVAMPDTSAEEVSLVGAQLLPDGETLLVVVHHIEGQPNILLLSNSVRSPIIDEANVGTLPFYTSTGHILYPRDYPISEGIWAIPFDPSSLTMTGRLFPVTLEGSMPSVSSDGTLVYGITGADSEQLVRMHRDTGEMDIIDQPQAYIFGPSLSPDQTKVAFSAYDQGNQDIWIYDMQTGLKSSITSDRAIDWSPTWSPSGEQIVFSSQRTPRTNIYIRRSDGTGRDSLLVSSTTDHLYPHNWSQDGRYLLYYARSSGVISNVDRDLWYKRMDQPGVPQLFLRTMYNEASPELSPDSRYVVYMSDETGHLEIYIRSFPDGNNKWKISENGGAFPKWNNAGDELFYLSGDHIMSVKISYRPNFRASRPKMLFDAGAAGFKTSDSGSYRNLYDVSTDGNQFMMIRKINDTKARITVIENWIKDFKNQ